MIGRSVERGSGISVLAARHDDDDIYISSSSSGRHAFAQPCEGVHRSTSLMNSSLLLQQCPACLVRLR